ncbi:MAG: PAS domain-containing protein [Steroidobacteraceae bacterium]
MHELRIALAEKQAQLNAVFEAARMASWRRDAATGQTIASETMADLWGLLPGQTFERDAQNYQLVHPDEVTQQRNLVNSVLARGGAWQSQFRVIRPRDGKTVWLEERGRVRIDPATGRVTIDALVCDITDRKLAESVLRESEARKTFLLQLDDVLRPLADPIRIQFEAARVLGRYLGADRAYYGRPEREFAVTSSTGTLGALRKGPPVVITDTGVSHSLRDETRDAYGALGIRAYASAPVIKEGALVWTLNVIASSAREWTADEIVLIREVAERTWAAAERAKAEAALNASEERFREFAAASSDILWIRDAHAMQFKFVSAAFSAVYGAPIEEAVGGNDLKRWAKLIDPEDRGAVFDALRRVRAGERVMHEFRIRRRSDGHVRWIRDTAFPLLGSGNIVEFIGGIAQDFTEEKAASDRLQVLVTELQHRTRNQIAVVRSLSDKSLAESRSLEDYRGRYGERLAALARVQRMLSRNSEGERVMFDELLRAELAAHGATSGRVFLQGPSGVRLRSSTVQTLALALHELATNAVKYGAIASPAGRLHVGWHVTENEDGTNRRLNIDWRESGVDIPDPAIAAQNSGYGRELIERALPYQLNARTRYEIGPAGVHCAIEVPISGALRAEQG